MNFEAASLADDLIVLTSSCNGNSSYRNLAAGFGERPVQQVLVFSLFFLTTILSVKGYWAVQEMRGKGQRN